MSPTLKFLLESYRVLNEDNYGNEDIELIFNVLLTLDNLELNEYYMTVTLSSFDNDLELYIHCVQNVLVIMEENERFEDCIDLKYKLDESYEIINKYKI